MTKNLLWKSLFIIAVLVVFVFGILGSPTTWNQGLLAAMQKNIHLGLDLKGGTHLILQVKVNDAVKVDAEAAVEKLKDEMRKKNIVYADISQPDPANQPDRIVIKGVPAQSHGELQSLVTSSLPQYELKSESGEVSVLSMKPQALSKMKDDAVKQAIETIRNRIDKLGVSEPVIEEHGLGQYQILVQLPGVDDPARVQNIMQSTAMLEIRQSLDGPTSYGSQQEALAAHGGVLPPGAVLLQGKSQAGPGEASKDVWYVISRASAVTGRDLRDAQPGRDEFGKPNIHFQLTADGGKKFSEFTRQHIDDWLAVVLDDKVQEVARIKSEIGDSGEITGAFTEQQAQDLAMILRSGALPAGINYLEERTVGPSLGADSIKDGVRAAVIGMVAVLIFMLVYYRGAGINADLALILNLVILLGFLGYSGATLTLPGIAGVILTVGMGVDSNVLIFERIREELRNGKTAPSAVEQGFAHAWITIVDTHVTTIVSAFILFIFGTGPVKGFAVTLTFGLLANLFTAVFVSRVIFDAGLNRMQRGEALSI